MALFAAWRVEKRLEEIIRADVPSAAAAEEFRAALQEERVVHATYLLDDGTSEWLAGTKRVESHLQNAIGILRGASDLYGDESAGEEGLLARLERAYAETERQRREAAALLAKGGKKEARQRLLAEMNGPLFKQADEICLQMAAAADEHAREHTGRAARRVHQVAWVIGISGGLTLLLGGTLLWLFFRRILFPLRGLVADAQLLHGNLLAGQDRSEEDEMRTVGDCFRTLMSDVNDTRSSLERSRSRLLVAEKLASVGKLAASVAHEIRNPLTAMKMWLFSVQESVRGDRELSRKLGIISAETTRLDQIVRDFLEFAPSARPAPPRIPHRPGDSANAGPFGRAH